MATFLSEPAEPRGFEIVARRVAAGETTTDALVEWSNEAVSRLVGRLYFVIRHEFMGRDQDLLRFAVDRVEELVDRHDFDDSSQERAVATVLRALVNRNARRYEVARILAEEVLEKAPDVGWTELRYDAYITLADADAQQGQPATAGAHYASAFKLAEKLGDDIACGRALLNMSALSLASGKPERAFELGKQAFERFLDIDAGTLAGWALIQQSAALQVLGNDEGAFESADRARNLFEVLGTDHGVAIGNVHVGLCHHLAMRLPEAKDAYDKAHRVASRANLGDIDNVEIYRAILAIDLGKFESARAELTKLSERTSESGRLPHLLVVLTALVLEAALRGDSDDLQRWFGEARNLHERIEYFEPMISRSLEMAADAAERSAMPQSAELRAFADEQRAGMLGSDD